MEWLVLTFALILRLVLLNQSLWLDESIEALALMGKMGPIMQYALSDFQPPLYHLIGYLWTSLAGYSEVALRIPSLVSGLFTVWYTIRIGTLLKDKKTGYMAGLLAATNPLLIYYSQEGRTYALTAFFITAGFYYFFRLLKNEKTSTTIKLCYMLFTAAAVWTSYIAWIAVGLQVIYLIISKQKKLLAYPIFSLATLIFWLPSFLKSLGIGLSTKAVSPEWGKIVGGISLKALALTWVKMGLGRVSFDDKYLYGGIVLALFALHGLVLRRLKKAHPLLFVWLLGPVVGAGLISLIVPVYSYTRVLFIVPAYLLLLALSGGKKLLYLLVFSQLAFLAYFWFTPRFHREDWRSLVRDQGSDGYYALPSRNQMAPLLYYGVERDHIFEPKTYESEFQPDLAYIKYAEDLFDGSRVGPARLEQSGYTKTGSRVYPGLQVDYYQK